MLRTRVRRVLAALSIAGLGIVALVFANVWWAIAACWVALGALAFATLQVAYFGRRAPFWLGFAVLGWVNLGLSQGNLLQSGAIQTLPSSRFSVLAAHCVMPHIPLNYWDPLGNHVSVDFDYGDSWVTVSRKSPTPSAESSEVEHFDASVASYEAPIPATPADLGAGNQASWQDLSRFTQIQSVGQSLSSLVAGCLGGIVFCDSLAAPPRRPQHSRGRCWASASRLVLFGAWGAQPIAGESQNSGADQGRQQRPAECEGQSPEHPERVVAPGLM